jgi:AraC-like DNA-binding protein
LPPVNADLQVILLIFTLILSDLYYLKARFIKNLKLQVEQTFTKPIFILNFRLLIIVFESKSVIDTEWRSHDGDHIYLIQRRLNYAANMLVETNSPIATITYDCGFGNQSHFNRTFKEIFKCSPGQFRKLHRG